MIFEILGLRVIKKLRFLPSVAKPFYQSNVFIKNQN